jgi:hypothetical protein
MKKIELDRRAAQQLGLSIDTVREVTAAFLDETAKALLDSGVGGEVQLDRFGMFHISRREGVMHDGSPCVKYHVSFRRAHTLRVAMLQKFGKPPKPRKRKKNGQARSR